jgi:hypothetical protein
MEEVEFDTLIALATSLAAEAKSLDRRIRDIKQQLQSKEDTSYGKQ